MQQEKVILKKVCTCSGFCLCLYELRCFLLLVIEGYMFDCCALARTPYIMCCCPLPLNYLDSYISCLPNSFFISTWVQLCILLGTKKSVWDWYGLFCPSVGEDLLAELFCAPSLGTKGSDCSFPPGGCVAKGRIHYLKPMLSLDTCLVNAYFIHRPRIKK